MAWTSVTRYLVEQRILVHYNRMLAACAAWDMAEALDALAQMNAQLDCWCRMRAHA